jgi:adapter protein MecA 1/2
MKIEKVNDNQIRCTLTKEDLASRQLKISELAYGTEKAKSLFRDMMQQANFEFGFEAEDIPLMIEAIPMNAECIVLIITKVEDPEELDTRFSRFAPSVHEDDETDDTNIDSGHEEVMDLFRKLQISDNDNVAEGKKDTGAAAHTHDAPEIPRQLIRLFYVDSMNTLLKLSSRISHIFTGVSSLYQNPKDRGYFLLLTHQNDQAEQFNKCCNIASEYGTLKKTLPTTPHWLAEHFQTVIAENAVQVLSQIGR